MRRIEYKVENEYDGYRVGDYLKHIKGVSTRILKALKLYKGGIELNGEHIRTIDKIKTDDIIAISIDDNPKDYIQSDIAVEILYDDDDIIIFNKPANMPCHQSKRHQSETLGNVFASYCEKTNQHMSFRPINRLDKDTSGIVVVAKNSLTACKLNGEINKRYLAVCCGTLPDDEGVIEAPIDRLDEIGIKRIVSDSGQYAKTEYKVLARGEKYTFIHLKLYTGRTHQIRVHMAYIGYPLAGDTMYGGDVEIINRQALHCSWVRFLHPVTGEIVECSSNLCEDIQKAVDTSMKTV